MSNCPSCGCDPHIYHDVKRIAEYFEIGACHTCKKECNVEIPIPLNECHICYKKTEDYLKPFSFFTTTDDRMPGELWTYFVCGDCSSAFWAVKFERGKLRELHRGEGLVESSHTNHVKDYGFCSMCSLTKELQVCHHGITYHLVCGFCKAKPWGEHEANQR